MVTSMVDHGTVYSLFYSLTHFAGIRKTVDTLDYSPHGGEVTYMSG